MAFEWSDVGEYLAKYGGGAVDVVGSVMSGNYIGAAKRVGQMVSGELKTENNPDAVMAALQNDPTAIVKLKEFESKNKSELVQLQMKKEEGWTDRYKAMCDADGHSTRPRIALIMAYILAAETILFTALIGYGISEGQAVGGYAALFGAMTLVPGGVLGKYFGELRREHAQRNGIEHKPLLTFGGKKD